MPIIIKRKSPRPGGNEFPDKTDRGYQLVDPRVGGQMNKIENATFVRSLEEAAYLIEQGFHIRMIGPGKRASLISPGEITITYERVS